MPSSLDYYDANPKRMWWRSSAWMQRQGLTVDSETEAATIRPRSTESPAATEIDKSREVSHNGQCGTVFEPRVLRETGRARAQVAAALLFLVLGLAMFGVDREVGDYGPILAGVGAIAAAAALTLMSRRGVEVSSKGVTLRYVIRRRSLRWDEVLSFSIGTARPGGRERQDRPVARLVSGEVLILPGADPMWFPSQAPHAVLHELETLRVRATVP